MGWGKNGATLGENGANLERSGRTEAVVIIKAAPQVSQKHGETVCCAAIDLYGRWLRLYPVSFRLLGKEGQFGRWDRIEFDWRKPADDKRPESRRINQDSIGLVGSLKRSERQKFLEKLIVTSLDAERAKGKSLALLKAEILDFDVVQKPSDKLAAEAHRFDQMRRQADLFQAEKVVPYQPCPLQFRYQYRTDDGVREGTCQDWESEATYFHWERHYGAADAVEKMKTVFGDEYPKKGMLLAMGTHSLWPDTWLINGVIRLDEINQPSLF